MALQLMKIRVAAETTVETFPAPQKFFYVTTADTPGGGVLTIDAGDFFDDTGAAAAELPALAPNNSMFNVYINGVLQMQGISVYTPGAPAVGSLVINVPADSDPVLEGSPIVLEVINFVPASTTTVNT
mgnify:CR=1 FL=1|jgi:hypothetical protein